MMTADRYIDKTCIIVILLLPHSRDSFDGVTEYALQKSHFFKLYFVFVRVPVYRGEKLKF